MNIDLQENSGESKIQTAEFPADGTFTGEVIDVPEFRIYIKQGTLNIIDRYLSSDVNNELGGVLVGNYCRNSAGEKFISIDNHIVAKHSNSSISRLTFTHETWEYINDILESEFPEKVILGWFHSHPGHTVFLSTYDIFIQENFFNLDYMVAYVYDPTIKERGFFYNRQDKTVKSGGYYIYDISESENELYYTGKSEKNNEVEPEEISLNPELKIKSGQESGLLKTGIYIMASVLAVNLLITLFLLFNYFSAGRNSAAEETLRELSEIRNENIKLKEKLDNYIVDTELKKNGLSQDLKSEKMNEPKNTVASVKSPVTEKTITDAKVEDKSVANIKTEEKSGKEITKYTVKPGDTLEKISRLFYNNREGIELIMNTNSIKNKADIKIGQVLEIPQ
jgi:proteasome lid subunit RPN8/RPN11/LysM repeat protein